MILEGERGRGGKGERREMNFDCGSKYTE